MITENNGKKGLIGVFGQFNFPKVPAANVPWFIFASVSNLEVGDHTFTVNLAYDETQMVVMSVGGEIKVAEGSHDVDLIIPAVNVVFPKFGSYTLTFRIGGDPMGSRILKVNETKPEAT